MLQRQLSLDWCEAALDLSWPVRFASPAAVPLNHQKIALERALKSVGWIHGRHARTAMQEQQRKHSELAPPPYTQCRSTFKTIMPATPGKCLLQRDALKERRRQDLGVVLPGRWRMEAGADGGTQGNLVGRVPDAVQFADGGGAEAGVTLVAGGRAKAGRSTNSSRPQWQKGRRALKVAEC